MLTTQAQHSITAILNRLIDEKCILQEPDVRTRTWTITNDGARATPVYAKVAQALIATGALHPTLCRTGFYAIEGDSSPVPTQCPTCLVWGCASRFDCIRA